MLSRYVFTEPPAGFRLIAPDLRGHGASTNPSGEFSFRQAADDVLGLLRHLGIDRVKAIGVSGGGITLLHMATAVPASIESMVSRAFQSVMCPSRAFRGQPRRFFERARRAFGVGSGSSSAMRSASLATAMA